MKKLVLAVLLFTTSFVKAQTKESYLLIGTYTSGKSEGIYVYKFNLDSISFTYKSKIKSENSSYLAIADNQKYVYAVNENGDNKGAVSAYSFDKVSGELKLLNTQLTNGNHPCYVAIDASGKNIIATNYSSGNIAVFKTNKDGSLTSAVQTIKHEGNSVFTGRQDESHVHSASISPDGKYVFAADLGNDRFYKYKFNALSPKMVLTPGIPAYYNQVPGSGPRHFAFHPNKKFCYLLNEISGKIVVYSYTNGNLAELQTVTSDNSFGGHDKGSADIHLTPNGKFLYATNRGTTNDIVAFAVGEDGKLTEIEHVRTGLHPRNFMIDPSGKLLLIANRDSNNVMVFKINQDSGKLEDTGVTLDIDKPVCLKMIQI